MLLKALAVTNSRGDTLDLPLEDPSSGIFVKSIDGLDPVKATLVSSSFANQNGEQYQSSRRETRDIKISLGLDPKYAIQDAKELRDQLYPYFMPKLQSLLTFKMFDRFAPNLVLGNLDVNIVGRVETFEAPLFTNDPQVDIVLRCFDPDFYDPNLVTVEGATSSDMTETIVEYAGNIETDTLLTMLVDRDVSDFSIYFTSTDDSLKTIDFSYPLVSGDILRIASKVGSKSVTLTRDGVDTSILYAISPQSAWLELRAGTNSIVVYTPGAPIGFEIQYINKYGGL
jgi:hypothetical protein